MKLLAILILFVEAVLARGWVGLVTSDKADNREMWWKNTRSVNMRDVREGRRMKNIPGQLIATRGSDTDTDTTRDREGLQCLQEELLLCTDQLTSTLQRCNIFSWACRNKKTKKCHWVPESPTKYFYRTRVRSLAMLVTHWLTNSLTKCRLVNLIDVSLACEDGNSKLVQVVDDEKQFTP